VNERRRRGFPAAGSGTYALALRWTRAGCRLAVGRRGALRTAAGIYVYLGSAFGAGGVRARLARHVNGSGRPHWHIDYLRAVCPVRGAWFFCGERRLEHDWSSAVAALEPARMPLRGFGASDCECASHLYWLPARGAVDAIGGALEGVTGVRPDYLGARALARALQ